uniref:Uncharacterized protein n=1 Tax=Arundo donax TaxID=35708 RepID=A0A0A8ZE38_ARUDO
MCGWCCDDHWRWLLCVIGYYCGSHHRVGMNFISVL